MLGKDSVVDQILTANPFEYSPDSGLNVGRVYKSSPARSEWDDLLGKLRASGRIKDIIALGHSHPTGSAIMGGARYTITPSDSLLSPSGGSPQFGISNLGDLLHFKSIYAVNSVLPVKYVAIAAQTGNGPMVRLYDLGEIIKVKRYKDVDRVPQITIALY